MEDKNFGLTEPEFCKLIIELKDGDEQLFEKIFLSQFENSLRFVKLKYNVSREISYDACMDSLIYFRKLLLSDKIHYGNLRALFNQMSGQRCLKLIAKQKKMQLSDTMPELVMEVPENQDDNLLILNNAWSRLGEECKKILKDFYYNDQKLYDIAEAMNKSAAAIRKQKERCINSLRLNFRHTL